MLRFRVVHVFDIAQTDGEPLPEPARVDGDPSVYTDRLQAYVAACGITFDRADVPFGADGVSTGGRIAVRPDLSPAEEFSEFVFRQALSGRSWLSFTPSEICPERRGRYAPVGSVATSELPTPAAVERARRPGPPRLDSHQYDSHGPRHRVPRAFPRRPAPAERGRHRIEHRDCSLVPERGWSCEPPSNRTSHSRGIRLYGCSTS